MKQLEKQQKKLAAKGIHVEIDSLRKDYDAQKAGGAADGTGIGGGNGKFDHHHFDARSVDAEIDVVGDDELGIVICVYIVPFVSILDKNNIFVNTVSNEQLLCFSR